MKSAYDEAMKAVSKEEASELLNKIVNMIKEEESDCCESEARSIARKNLGFYAGYFDHETRIRVEDLFECSHPIFGPAKDGAPTPEEAFNAGMAFGILGANKI